MSTSVARKAAVPAGVTLVKAWSAAMPPRLCAAKAEPAAAQVVRLPCENQVTADGAAPEAQQLLHSRQKPSKSFEMHVGGKLHIPTKNAHERPHLDAPAPRTQLPEGGIDPFEGLPFRGFAEKLGDAVMPSLKAAREAERTGRLQARKAAAQAEVMVPQVPHVLPFTRWAAHSKTFRDTFIADPPKERKKARLSWYHPDDTMVPRDWFRGGLLADLKYYMPFGLGGGSPEQQASS